MTLSSDLLWRVKDALDKGGSSTSDAELLDLVESALAEYAEHVGPLPGSQPVVVSGGGGVVLVPRNATAVTAASYVGGASIPLTDLDLASGSGLLYWRVASNYGFRNVTLTVTFGDLPANHAAAIVEDIAEYWTRTQRAGGGQRPQFGGDGVEPEQGRPLVQFPRIRALRSAVSIA